MIKTKTAITFLLVCASSVAISFTTSASRDTAEEESYYESIIETMNSKETISTIRESKHVEREIEEDITGFVDDFNHSDYLNDVVLRTVENKEEYTLDATSIEYSNSVYIIEKEIYYYLADGWHDEITIYNPSEDEGNVSFEFVIKG